jgi:hypothetical protein
MALTLGCGSPPNAVVGTPYSHQMPITDGTPPYVCSITAGALPTGLSISQGALITGTPTAAGTFNFTAKVFDSATPPPLLDLTGALADWHSYWNDGQVTVDGSWVKAHWAGSGLGSVAEKSVDPAADTTVVGGADTDLIGITCKTDAFPSEISRIVVALYTWQGYGANPAAWHSYEFRSEDGWFADVVPGQTFRLELPRSEWAVSLDGDWSSVTLLWVCPVFNVAESKSLWFKDLTVRNANPAGGSEAACSITVDPSVLVLDCNTPPTGYVGAAYSHHMTLAGGTQPYDVTISSGALPAGLSISDTGHITGTPVMVGTFAFDVTAADSGAQTETVSCSITIELPPLDLECANPPSGAVNVPYTHQMLLTGGNPPYAVSVTAGALPTGLSIDAAGRITGTPTVAGVYTFTVTATESA